jgi:glycosyltransferase involved in cell wall biosynthesis
VASIDVAVPCYQYGSFLRACVTSILAQDVSALRVLIIDNASTDDSLAVARELASADPRVEVVAHGRNLGATASYNEGIEWSSADYFLLLDADDMLAPGCLARAVALMEDNPDVSFTYGVELRQSFSAGDVHVASQPAGEVDWQIVAGRDFIERLCRRPINHVGATTVVRRTRAQKQVGHYRSEIPYTDDLDMWLRLATVGNVAYTSAVQAFRRLHASQATRHYTDVPVRDFVERERAYACFFEAEGRTLAHSTRLHRQARSGLVGQAYWSGLSHIFRAQPRTGWALLRYAWQRSPSTVVLPPLGYLLQMDRPLGRLAEVMVEGITGSPQGRWLRTNSSIET